MGHRASVAYWDGDNVSAHYSHWGALDLQLLDEITPETPFGSTDLTPDVFHAVVGVLAEATAGDDDATVAAHEEPSVEAAGVSQNVPIEPEAYWEGDTLHEWATEAIDYLHHEAAYLVDVRGDEWEVRAFVPVRYLGYEPTDDVRTHDHGALIEVDGADEYGDIYCVEYDWQREHAGVDDDAGWLAVEEGDGLSELAFAMKLHDEFSERQPTFCRYHESRYPTPVNASE